MLFSWPTAVFSDSRVMERPKIGLALSGGGARGAAHVGVLRVLEELRVPIDYIAGTSMGSIVGGLYASGMSVDEIEQALVDIEWDEVFKDRRPREKRRFRRKLDDYTFLIDYKIGVDEKEKSLNIAPALIQGQKFDLILNRYLLPVATVRDFNRLRIPFRAVATDIVTGDAVVLGRGELTRAIRASMAVPAAFAPVEVGDQLLVDGGVSNNLPIDVVREMGADIVIAVDISTPAKTRDEIKSALDMLNQLSALLTRRGTMEQIASLNRRDLLIVPDLGDKMTSADFSAGKMRDAISIGAAAAISVSEDLGKLALSDTGYRRYSAGIEPGSRAVPRVDYVRVENKSRLSDEVITRRLDVPAGEPIEPGRVENAVEQIYDQDNFESVNYRVEENEGETGIVVEAREKSWGTSSLQFGFNLSATSTDDSYFDIGAAYTKIPLNELNGEWRTFLRLGQEPTVYTEVYQPLDPDERWFVGFGGGYSGRDIKIYASLNDDAPDAEYDVESIGINATVGRNLGDWGRVALRYVRESGSADAVLGTRPLDDFDFDTGAAELRFSIDTLDNVYFPSDGTRAELYGRWSREGLGADDNFEQFGGSYMAAGRYGAHHFNALAYLVTTPGDDAPIQDYFTLGGFAKLSGFNENQLAGQHAGLIRGSYFYAFDTKLVKTYAGGTLEAGNVWQDRDDMALDDLLYAGSLFLGMDTVLGPVFLAYGHAEGGNNGVYLLLGRPWYRF
jgi:NTE family protein